MAMVTLEDLIGRKLKDLYNAEKQLMKVLPKLARAATNEDLKAGFEEHLEKTQGHVERLEEIFASIERGSRGGKCEAMQGLIEESSWDRVEAAVPGDADKDGE